MAIFNKLLDDGMSWKTHAATHGESRKAKRPRDSMEASSGAIQHTAQQSRLNLLAARAG
jgi:hypothetical protein